MTIADLAPLALHYANYIAVAAIPYRGKPAADGPRYRALGVMVVPVVRWLGRRIELIEREFGR